MEIIRSLRSQIDRALRNSHTTGAATASSAQGPMLVHDLWTAALDTTNAWTTSLVGTGTAAVAAVTRRRVCQLDCPAGADKAAIRSTRIFWSPTVASLTTDIYQQLVLEWEMALTSVANIDNTRLAAGFGGSAPGERGDTGFIGFGLASDALQSVTDSAGTETETSIASAPTLTDFNKFKIVVRNAAVDFYVNDTLRNTHTANLAAVPQFVTFSLRSEAAVAARMDVGAVRCYLLD